jgi:hypothetical protein
MVKRGGSLSFLVGTISSVLVMEIGWTDVGSRGYILVSCAHSSNTSFFLKFMFYGFLNLVNNAHLFKGSRHAPFLSVSVLKMGVFLIVKKGEGRGGGVPQI